MFSVKIRVIRVKNDEEAELTTVFNEQNLNYRDATRALSCTYIGYDHGHYAIVEVFCDKLGYGRERITSAGQSASNAAKSMIEGIVKYAGLEYLNNCKDR